MARMDRCQRALEQIELARAIRMQAVEALVAVDPDYADEVMTDLIYDVTVDRDAVRERTRSPGPAGAAGAPPRSAPAPMAAPPRAGPDAG